jgi:hypothetical protein
MRVVPAALAAEVELAITTGPSGSPEPSFERKLFGLA